MTILTLVTALGALQALLLSAVLLLSRDRARRLLGLFSLSVALMIGGTVVMHTDVVRELPALAFAHVPFNFLVAPLFYLFARAIVRRDQPRIAIHALPAVAIVIVMAPLYARIGEPLVPASARLALLVMQGLAYLIATFAMLRREDAALFFATSVMSLAWIGATAKLFWSFSPMYIPSLLALAAIAASAMFLRPDLSRRTKYSASTLTADRADRYAARIVEALERDRLFLSGDLTIEVLGERLRIPRQHLSQIVNQRMGTNFNDWVNRFRVEEAMRRLRDPRDAHLSIVAIAEEAGFRSKSAFNAAFRRIAGTTPSTYRRSVRNDDSGRPES